MVGRKFFAVAAAVVALSAVAAWGRDDASAAARRDAAWAAGKNVSFEGSDLIGKLGYDAETRVLRVQMIHSSDWYLYQDVPAEVAEKFYRSASKGGYFGAHVKGRYEFVRQE
jgi:hypothetical protein